MGNLAKSEAEELAHAAERAGETPAESTQSFRERSAHVIAVLAAAFHIATGAVAPLPAMQHRIVHLTLGLIIVFLLHRASARGGGRRVVSSLVDGLMLFLSVATGAYVFFNSDSLLRLLQPDLFQTIVAFVLTGLVLEATRRTTGWILPLLGLISIAYALFGQHLGGLFQHSGASPNQIARNLALSTEGILGIALGVSATYVILFVLFGSLLQLCGAGELVLKLSEIIAGRYRGGHAKAATIASGLFGSISGSPVGNVAATGPVTIPMMKASGFSPKTAAAVEAAASTGGMIMPPVMGATAFLIAEILTIPYSEVVKAALIPAVLYYAAILFTIDSYAARLALRGTPTQRALRALGSLLMMRGYQLLPLAVLIYMLVGQGTTAARAAFWGLIVAAVLALVAAVVAKSTRRFPKALFMALSDGFRSMVVIIMACATAGIVMGVMGVTGLGFRLSYILTELSGGSVAILLILTMLASIILGMSLPAVAAYLILAVTVAPALSDLGVEPLAAHLFVFYFGVLSNITPPVALAAFTAAGIAGSKPNETGLEAVRFALSGFLIPFILVFSPGLILIGQPGEIAFATLTALAGILALSGAVAGYCGGLLGKFSRALLVVTGILLVVPEFWSSALGLALFAAVFIYINISSRKGHQYA